MLENNMLRDDDVDDDDEFRVGSISSSITHEIFFFVILDESIDEL